MPKLDPIAMDKAQIRHLEDVREFWARYVAISARRDELRGAMGWKTVNDTEYLTAYFTDPVTGKKVMKSRGRRSPETEREKAEFDLARAETDQAAADMKRDLEPLIRVGKALRIGRLDPVAGDVLRELARKELLGSDLMVIGSAAMHLYEASAGALLPRTMIASGDLDLFTVGAGRQETLELLLPIIQRADKSFALQEGSKSLQSADGYRVHMHTRRSLGRAFERLGEATDRQIETLNCLLDYAPVSAVTIARDGSPVRMTGMDPRCFALLRHAAATLDSDRDGAAVRLAQDQAYAVGRLVSRFGAKSFDDEMMAAFPEFVEAVETGDPEVAETVGRFFRL